MSPSGATISSPSAKSSLSSNNILLSHKTTEGYEKSINDGFKLATRRGASIIVTIDADGEHKVSDIVRIIRPILNNEADLVIGARIQNRHFLENIYGLLSKAMFGISDPLSGLKAYKINVYKSVGFFDCVGSIGIQLSVRAVKNGFILFEVPIETKIRKDRSRFYSHNLLSNLRVLRSMVLMVMGKL